MSCTLVKPPAAISPQLYRKDGKLVAEMGFIKDHPREGETYGIQMLDKKGNSRGTWWFNNLASGLTVTTPSIFGSNNEAFILVNRAQSEVNADLVIGRN